jgi:hypothetical protein
MPQELQDYPRTKDYLAKDELFPIPNPPLSLKAVDEAVEIAFSRCLKNKKGDERYVVSSTKELVDLCLNHLKKRSDPALSPFFFSQIKADEVFDMDAVAHEMQRQRMKIGNFYQYLLIELMRSTKKAGTSNIKDVFDGLREGDALADIVTPTFTKGLRLYISVKKSVDTVGGQDFEGAVKRLEAIAKADKNLTSPYLCVIAIATGSKGEGRSVRCKQGGMPYSMNCEVWMPDFIYPYITGLTPLTIYKEALKKVGDCLPFYTLKVRETAAPLLKQKFIEMGISNEEGTIDRDKFFDFILS